MTNVLRTVSDRRLLLSAFLTLLVLLSCSVVSSAADIAVEEARPEGEREKPVDESRSGGRGRVVVPEPSWGGWDRWEHGHPWYHHGAPRVELWVDRGPWGVYAPGDPLWVFFRTDRSCYVTIIDYAPDGSVRVLFPNRWSGSSYVRPGRTYRIPRDGHYSLRIAGPGGVETLVACAHEVPWPSGYGGAWVPPRRPHRGRVIVDGRPGSWHSPGRPGRVVIPQPGYWPVPGAWHDIPGGWSCDEISFRVVGYGWNDYHGDPWHDHYGDRRYGHPDDPRWNDRRGSEDARRIVFRDVFTIDDVDDAFFHELSDEAVLAVECVEGRDGEPTEIVGRIEREGDQGRTETLFRIDVEGRRGHRPDTERTYEELLEPEDLMLEMRVLDFSTERPRRWDPPVIRWIRFEVEIFED